MNHNRSPLLPAICLSILLSILFMSPAHAGQKEDIAELRAMFESALTEQKNAAALRGGKLQMEGDLKITPVENYYTVMLPELAIHYMSGSLFNIGKVAINTLKGDTPGSWKMTVALPSPMFFYPVPDEKPIEINIGQQRFSGLWNSEMQSFPKLKAEYQDIRLSHPDDFDATIADIKILTNLDKNGENNWSGPASVRISKLVFSDADIEDRQKAEILHMGEIAMDINIHDYSTTELSSYREKFNALAESYQEDETISLSPQHTRGIYNLIFDFLGNAWDGIDAEISVSDLRASGTPEEEGGNPENLNIKKAGFGYSLKGFRKDSVTFQTHLFFEGMDLFLRELGVSEDEQEALEMTAPKKLEFKIGIENLPYSKLVELGDANLKSAQSSPEEAQNMKMQSLMLLPQYLTEAQSKVTIDPLHIKNDHYNALLNASFTADLEAAKSATGTAKLSLGGLDTMAAYFKQKQTEADQGGTELPEAARQKINDALGALTILQMLGQQETDPEGNPVRAYNFELTKNGETLLNGADLQTLFASMNQP